LEIINVEVYVYVGGWERPAPDSPVTVIACWVAALRRAQPARAIPCLGFLLGVGDEAVCNGGERGGDL
jgi:hypothetical protein